MRFGPDVKNLMRKILEGYTLYFSNDILNTEGRKIFEEMARMLIDEHPELKPMVKRIRRNSCLRNVIKLARLILGEQAESIPILSVQGPYYYLFKTES